MKTHEAVGASAIVSAMFNAIEPLAWYSAGVLLTFALVLSTIELIMSAEKVGRLFDWRREIVSRIFILFLVPISLMADVSLYLLAQFIPHEYLLLDRGWLFFSITTLIWINAAFTLKVTHHVGERSGKEYVPPTIGALTRHVSSFIRAMRLVDEKRYQEEGHDGPPPKRWIDNLTEEQLAQITKIVSGLDRKDVPLEPEEILDEEKG